MAATDEILPYFPKASIADRYRKIKIAPTISFTRKNWIDYVEMYGWVWSDERGDWSFTWDGVQYWGLNLSKQEWRDNIIKYGQRFGSQVVKTGTYELRQDENGLWFYYDDLGKKVYSTNDTQDVKADIFIGDSIFKVPNYDFSDDTIKDILGNPIVPKTPEVGLYDTKIYLDSIEKKRAIYKQFYSAKTQTEKLNAISVRAADIVAEQNKLISDLNKAGANIKRENIIINTVVGGFGSASIKSVGAVAKLNPIGIGLTVFGFVKKYAASKTTGRREQLRSEDLLYLEEELNAIKSYIEKNGLSSDSGNADKKTIYWIIGVVVVLGIVIYFLVRNK